MSINSSRQINNSLKTAPVSTQNISPSVVNFSQMVKPPLRPKLGQSSIEVQDQKKYNPDIFNPMFDDTQAVLEEEEPIVHNPRQITTAAL